MIYELPERGLRIVDADGNEIPFVVQFNSETCEAKFLRNGEYLSVVFPGARVVMLGG